MNLKSCNDIIKCYRCHHDRIRNSKMIFLFKENNVMNFESFSFHLSFLSITKKLFIARAHVLTNFRRVKEYQYKYSEHVVNFIQNTKKIIHRFLNLSVDLQMLVLKFASSFARNSNISMRFRKTFRVRKKHVKI
jgi:hypothetical protein